MSVNNIDEVDIKLTALEEAISYPSLKDRNFNDTCLLEVESFSYDLISSQISNSDKFTNLEGAKMDMILEIIRLLDDYSVKFNVELHNTIGFYFRGLPIVIVRILNNKQQQLNDRFIYISVKVYKDVLTQGLNDRKLSRILAGSVGGALVLGGVVIGYMMIKKWSRSN
jgi:hypothetical protein